MYHDNTSLEELKKKHEVLQSADDFQNKQQGYKPSHLNVRFPLRLEKACVLSTYVWINI
jgi:hypothetical protein